MPCVGILLDGLWLLQETVSSQLGKFHWNSLFIPRVTGLVGIFKWMVHSMRPHVKFRHRSVLLFPPPFSSVFTSPSDWSSLFLTFHFPNHITCLLLLPSSLFPCLATVPFKFLGFCSYSRMPTHILRSFFVCLFVLCPLVHFWFCSFGSSFFLLVR